MGKKRQKVQWFPVDGLAWAGGEDGALQVGGGHQPGRGLMRTAVMYYYLLHAPSCSNNSDTASYPADNTLLLCSICTHCAHCSTAALQL